MPTYKRLAFAALAAVIADNVVGQDLPEFEAFIQTHGRSYEKGTQEYLMRQGLYESARIKAQAQNSQPGNLWTATVNQFSDWSEDEMTSLMGWVRKSAQHPSSSQMSFISGDELMRANTTLPESASWEHLKEAKNIPAQGHCGSCWAVTTAAVLNAHHEIHRGSTRRFSAQELVNCVPNPQECGGEGGCHGATVELGMQYAQEQGLHTDEEVPYKGSDMPCRSGESKSFLQTKGGGGGSSFGLVAWRTLPVNKEEPLARALVELGPVAVSVAARSWGSYHRGIFDACSKDCVIGHAVTLYGYGKEGPHKYWKIRNSWGPNWGENGYIRLMRHGDEEGYCGEDNDPQKGTGCKGGPPKVQVCGTCGVLYDSVVPVFQDAASSLLSTGKAKVRPLLSY